MKRISSKRGAGMLTFALTLALAGQAAHAGDAAPPVAASATTSSANHQRLLPLQGGQNFRDLGGYTGADGKRLRWGLLYRSGSMHDLTPADFAYLDKLHIRTVVDFRSPEERNAEPVAWPEKNRPTILTKDYALETNPMMKALFRPGLTADDARSAMTMMYGDIPFQFADQYRRMFAELLHNDTPLVFNCTAGKDRTGVAAALLLTVMGVSREAVMEDYLLSNRYFRPEAGSHAMDEEKLRMFRAIPPQASQALVAADRQYLEGAFTAIEKRPGGMDRYLHEQLGLSPADVATLRARYLQ